ncbi:uncharacterized protein LOC143841496 [Paroedura picta]|uniref:uncharacterized protein LOC143841496 n=1 Tax=Paroedura picta TaxID=143630 RepID=UPI0040559F5B
MRSLKIWGVTGMVSITESNRRKTDFYLWSMADVESGQYQVVAHYNGSVRKTEWLGPIPWKPAPPLLPTGSVSSAGMTPPVTKAVSGFAQASSDSSNHAGEEESRDREKEASQRERLTFQHAHCGESPLSRTSRGSEKHPAGRITG